MERYKEQIKKYGVINDEDLLQLRQKMKKFCKANITYADISNVRIETSQALSLQNPLCPLACDEVNYETCSYISESNFEIACEKPILFLNQNQIMNAWASIKSVKIVSVLLGLIFSFKTMNFII